MRRLLTHLAQFSSFAKQGELLCTQGLAHLLQHDEARAAFARHVSGLGDIELKPDLTWRAEVCQSEDLGRPDLEGCSADQRQVVKVEGKLGAALSPGQLRSYVRDLDMRCTGGLLFVLVPSRRKQGASEDISTALGVSAEGPWRLPSGCTVGVIFWEDVIESLRSIRSEAFRGDLEQFEAMYHVLNRHIRPLASDVGQPDRLDDLILLVERVTRRVAEEGDFRLLPMAESGRTVPYHRRYVCPPLGGQHPCFSVGVRHPVAGHTTFVWLRFNRTTAKFPLIHSRLLGSELSGRLVESGGHIWIPLEVPLHTEEEGMAASLMAQIHKVMQVAYAPLA